MLLLLLAAPRCEPPAAPGMVDGDTLRLADGRRVRLPGIDAPESGRPFADEATSAAQRFLARGAFELDPAEAPSDRYGRLLADVRVRGESLSAALVAAGLAWVGDEADDPLRALQAEAVAARRGMHALLDLPLGPYAVTGTRFHAPDCPFLRSRGDELPLDADVAGLFTSGRAPCRVCLPWPPRTAPSVGSPHGPKAARAPCRADDPFPPSR